MKQDWKIAVSVCALLVPVSLVGLPEAIRIDGRAFDPTGTFLSWLYMAAPQLVAVAVAALYRPARDSFLPRALVGSAVLVTIFRAWVWLAVPTHESGLVWVLYIPLWMTGLMVIAAGLQWRQKADQAR